MDKMEDNKVLGLGEPGETIKEIWSQMVLHWNWISFKSGCYSVVLSMKFLMNMLKLLGLNLELKH